MFALATGPVVDDHDVLDLLDGLVRVCVDLHGVAGAGLLLSDQRGQLQLVASSDEAAHALELVQVEHAQGPCVEAIHAGQAVTVTDLASAGARWPLFIDTASGLGYRSVSTLPMRLRDRTIGGLDLYASDVPALSSGNQRIAQALADATTVALLQQHSVEQASQLAEQLEKALGSRILIEQAKGILAERGGLSTDAAFASLRAYARNNNHRLSLLAESVVRGQAPLDDVLATNPDER